jgi:hypothetical protein
MLGGGTRVKVRINGRADGGALVIVGPDTTDEQFVAAAAKKVFKRDAAAAAAVDPTKAIDLPPGREASSRRTWRP